uniref:MACPF domain-containing protein n=1 Tax=Ciona savignyi TaxID=51511 RepID=H2YTD0_CIOSA
MIRRSFILSYQFQLRLKELPDDFDYTKYAEVISDFGSHYYSSGVLGGKYEYVYRYSKSALRSSGLSNVDQQNCLRQEASTSFLGFGGSAARSKCSTNFLSIKNKGSFTRSATNAVSNVIGGSSDKAAALSFFASKSPNQANYNEWVKTVKNNPAVIDYMLSPISAAVPFSMPHKRRNMERALVYYLQEYNFSKCKGKCANNGAVVVTNNGKLCKCLCASGFGGIDCNVRA